MKPNDTSALTVLRSGSCLITTEPLASLVLIAWIERHPPHDRPVVERAGQRCAVRNPERIVKEERLDVVDEI